MRRQSFATSAVAFKVDCFQFNYYYSIQLMQCKLSIIYLISIIIFQICTVYSSHNRLLRVFFPVLAHKAITCFGVAATLPLNFSTCKWQNKRHENLFIACFNAQLSFSGCTWTNSGVQVRRTRCITHLVAYTYILVST